MGLIKKWMHNVAAPLFLPILARENETPREGAVAKVEVYALIGASGTGKSHMAMTVAIEHGIDTLIDDGLLIREGEKLAGVSAKGEKTAMSAVKRAIFLREEQREEVVRALKETAPEKLLILGTSKKMADRISDALGLPRPSRYLHIDEVSSPSEIATAMELRKTYGMHVVPVPVVEVKEDLQGYLMRPIRYLLRLKSGNKQGEKTIIQPKFSTVGKLVITGRALGQMIVFLCADVPGVANIIKIHTEVKKGNGVIRLELSVRLPGSIPDMADTLTRLMQDRIPILCGIHIEQVHLLIRACVVDRG